MAKFKGRQGRDDNFTGTEASDRFLFNPADLTGADTIVGGDGAGVDTLVFTTAAAIGLSQLAGVSGIERVQLATGTNSLVLSDALVSTADGARLRIVATNGDELIYGARLTGANAIDYIAHAGVDAVICGAGADRFFFTVADLTAADTIVGGGGAGVDTLLLSGSGSLGGEQMSGISGLEAIVLGDGGVSLVLSDALARTSNTGGMTITGGRGDDVIDASSVTATALTLIGGAGDDTITGGAFGAFADGGAGADTIILQKGGIVYDADDVRETVGQGTLYIRQAATIDLRNRNDQSLSDRAVVTGFQDVVASGAKQSVTLTGLQFGALIGGSGDDVITGGSYIVGGKGADILTGSDSDYGTNFVLAAGDFARGEEIHGHSRYGDDLFISGSVDLRIGTVEGVTGLSISTGTRAHTTVTLSAAEFADISSVTGNADADHAITVRVRFGRDDSVSPVYLTAYGATVELSFSGRDNVISGYSGTIIYAGAGDDSVTSESSIYGEAGDDTIIGDVYSGLRDGGEGTDTLVLSGHSFDPVVIDLAAKHQGVSGVSEIAGFENVDVAQVWNDDVTIDGSKSDNVIRGSFGSDALSGGRGDDTLSGGDNRYSDGRDQLDGGGGDDRLMGSSGLVGSVMTGGAGADTFQWSYRPNEFEYDPMDQVTDFKPGQDHLKFLESAFEFSGSAFDTLVVAHGTKTDISGADLVLVKGRTIDGMEDVIDYINVAAGGDHAGVFVAGLNSDGEAVLYHSLFGDYADDTTVSPIAELGDIGKLTHLSLSDFAFI